MFDLRDTQGGNTCPACGTEHPPSVQLIKCAHEGCEVLLCGLCAQVCRCGDECGPRCEEHLYLSTLNGALSRPIKVCKACKDEDYDQVLCGEAVPTFTECLQRCQTINEVEHPDGRCLGCQEDAKRGKAA